MGQQNEFRKIGKYHKQNEIKIQNVNIGGI